MIGLIGAGFLGEDIYRRVLWEGLRVKNVTSKSNKDRQGQGLLDRVAKHLTDKGFQIECSRRRIKAKVEGHVAYNGGRP